MERIISGGQLKIRRPVKALTPSSSFPVACPSRSLLLLNDISFFSGGLFLFIENSWELGRNQHWVLNLENSSRYWLAGSFEERFQKGLEPENVDKEFLKLWFKDHCDPYKDLHLHNVLPTAPADLVTELAWRYIFLYETITGSRIDIHPTQEPIHDRISGNTSHALSSLRQL